VGVAFLVVELRVAEPLLELRLLRDPRLSGATAIATLIYLALLGFLLVNTVYLQQVRGLTALKTGAAMLPCSFMLATGSLLSGRLLGRLGARPVLLAGPSASPPHSPRSPASRPRPERSSSAPPNSPSAWAGD
jgi:predicted MFS family arabinose efflux permease